MEPNVLNAVFLAPGQGKSVWVIDELMRWIVTGEETGGAYSILESHVPPDCGPPPHIHHREDEGFWVIEGELEVMVNWETHRAGPGTYVHLPKDVPHTFRTLGSVPARFLTLMVPAGLEGFFEKLGIPGDDINSPPTVTKEMIDSLIALAPEYGLEVLADDSPAG